MGFSMATVKMMGDDEIEKIPSGDPVAVIDALPAPGGKAGQPRLCAETV